MIIPIQTWKVSTYLPGSDNFLYGTNFLCYSLLITFTTLIYMCPFPCSIMIGSMKRRKQVDIDLFKGLVERELYVLWNGVSLQHLKDKVGQGRE